MATVDDNHDCSNNAIDTTIVPIKDIAVPACLVNAVPSGNVTNQAILNCTMQSRIKDEDAFQITESPSAKRAKRAQKPLRNFGIVLTGSWEQPISENELKNIIRELGGDLREEVSPYESTDEPQNFVLVSNKPRTTSKFLKAIALHIPCVSPNWLLDMQRAGLYLSLENYRLPLGSSNVYRGTNGNFHWKRSAHEIPYSSLEAIFTGMSVFVASVNVQRKTWESIFRWLGGEVVDRRSFFYDSVNGDMFSCQYVLLEGENEWHDQQQELKRAKALGIPCVTVVWLIQCLLHGSVIPYNLHRSFRVD